MKGVLEMRRDEKTKEWEGYGEVLPVRSNSQTNWFFHCGKHTKLFTCSTVESNYQYSSTTAKNITSIEAD